MIPSIILSLVSGILLILSFPPIEISWLIWIAFVPLFSGLKEKSYKQSFCLTYLTGVIFWISIIYWMNFVTILGYGFLVLYLSLYFAFFGLYFKFLEQTKLNKFSLILIPTSWVAFEFVRANLFTGFGWALIGYSQYKNLPLIQISDVLGAYGTSFFILLVNFTIFYIVKNLFIFLDKKSYRWEVKKKVVTSIIYVLITLICTGAILYYGSHKLNTNKLDASKSVKVSVIQGSFPAQQKWIKGRTNKILKKYINLTYKAKKEKPDIIVWPETAIPVYFNKKKEFKENVIEVSKKISIPLLIGVPWMEHGNYYNAAIFLSKKGDIINKYKKIHLVPFGEYFPFFEYFPGIENIFQIGNYSAGDSYTVFELPNKNISRRGVKFSVLICYEDIFPDLVRKFTNRGSSFLINITDDSWFKKTGATYQHTQALVFRAVENRKSIVRAANTGLSCFITPEGEIVGKVKNKSGKELFISGYNTESVTVSDKVTFYQKYGNVFVYVCLFIILISLNYGIFKKKFSSNII